MKSSAMPRTEQLNEDEKKQLSAEVKETLAIDANDTNKKFTVADMWNNHRNRRSASVLIRRWNMN